MSNQNKAIEVIESAEYGLEDFLNDVITQEEPVSHIKAQTDGEKIYRYIKENM